MENSSFMKTRPELEQIKCIKTTSGLNISQVQVLINFYFRSITWYNLLLENVISKAIIKLEDFYFKY